MFLQCVVAWHLFIRIDAANEVVYEVTAEPQEQPEQAQKEVHKDSAQGPVDPSSEQQPEGKPRCMTYYFKLWNTIYLLFVHYVLEIDWNPSCMIPRFSGPYTSMCRSVALLCLIGLSRSRVISCYSRDIGCPYVLLYELLCSRWDGWKIGDRAGNV